MTEYRTIVARRIALGAALFLGLTLSATAHGITADLTGGIGDSDSVNGAIFRVDDPDGSSGTGVLDPFVRMQYTGPTVGPNARTTQYGYNTSGRPVAFDENTTLIFTHDLRLVDVPVRVVDSRPYFEFLLDINEPNGGGDQFLSLDELQIYTSAVPGQNTPVVSTLGVLRYDLDAGVDSHIRLDWNSIGSGSGRADMTALIPIDYFEGASARDYLYLYSSFGAEGEEGEGDDFRNWSVSGGFEEWAIDGVDFYTDSPPPVVPEPITMVLLGGSLTSLGAYLRKRIA